MGEEIGGKRGGGGGELGGRDIYGHNSTEVVSGGRGGGGEGRSEGMGESKGGRGFYGHNGMEMVSGMKRGWEGRWGVGERMGREMCRGLARRVL